jgi:hypothetical protein
VFVRRLLGPVVNGKRVLYIGAWRRSGDTWQIFDHHVVGVVEGSEPPDA